MKPDLKSPPIEPGVWEFTYAGEGSVFGNRKLVAEHEAKTWFAARAKVCAFFECEPGDVVCVGRPV